MIEFADQHQLKLCCCLLHLCSLLQVHLVLALIHYFAIAVSCCSAAFVLWCCLASTESVEPTHPAVGGHRYLLGCLQLWCKSKDALPCILDLCLTLRWGAAFKPVLDRFLSCRNNGI